MKTTWKPGNGVALQFGTTDLDSVLKVQAGWPGLWAPTKQLESRKY